MSNYFSEKIEYYFPDKQKVINRLKYMGLKWLRDLRIRLVKIIFIFLFTWLGYAFIFIFLKYIWFSFQHTVVGATFIANHDAERVLNIVKELDRGVLMLSLRLCYDALLTCLIIAPVLQVLGVRRYFYYGYGVINRICWFVGIDFICAWNLLELNYGPGFSSGKYLYFIPVCCFFDASLSFAEKLLPEIYIFFNWKPLRDYLRVLEIRNMGMRSKSED